MESSSFVFELLKLFLIGGLAGTVFALFLKAGEWKENKKKKNLKKD